MVQVSQEHSQGNGTYRDSWDGTVDTTLHVPFVSGLYALSQVHGEHTHEDVTLWAGETDRLGQTAQRLIIFHSLEVDLGPMNL